MKEILYLVLVYFVLVVFGCTSNQKKHKVQVSQIQSDARLEVRNPAQTVPISELCQSLVPSSLNSAARSFLVRKKMIKPDEKMYVFGITSNLSSCFLILSPLPGELSDTVEILAYDPRAKKIQTVEAVFPAPEVIRAGIGGMWKILGHEAIRVTNFFYYDLTGSSALDAHKSIVSKFPFNGLANGCIEAKITSQNILPTGKLPWDPTTGREWKLAYVEYSLKRGSPNEVDDIYSYQLDGDFAGYMKGSLPCNMIKQDRGSVQSWSSIIAVVFNATSEKWEAVEYDPRFSLSPEASKTTHEVVFKSQSDGNLCIRRLTDLKVTKQLSPIEAAPGFPPYGAYVNFNEPISDNIEKVKELNCVSSVNKMN